jgi:Acyl dehydratase
MSLLTDELKARVGTTVTYTAPEPWGAASGRYFAYAIGDFNPIYLDPDRARALGLPDVTIPPTLVLESAQYANLPIREDGYAGHLWGFDVPGTRLVRGGNSYRFYRRMRPDDVVTVSFTLKSITPKVNREGKEMLIFATLIRVTDQHGKPIAEADETFILVALGEEEAK